MHHRLLPKVQNFQIKNLFRENLEKTYLHLVNPAEFLQELMLEIFNTSLPFYLNFFEICQLTRYDSLYEKSQIYISHNIGSGEEACCP